MIIEREREAVSRPFLHTVSFVSIDGTHDAGGDYVQYSPRLFLSILFYSNHLFTLQANCLRIISLQGLITNLQELFSIY